MGDQLYITVSQAATEKEYSYQDAFGPCDDCGNDQPVFSVQARYSNMTLLSTFVFSDQIGQAVTQAVDQYNYLHARIDAADADLERREAAKAELAELDAAESDLVGDEAEAS